MFMLNTVSEFSLLKQPRRMEHNLTSIFLFILTEESEAASKQVLAKSEQIRKFQEENKYLGQLVSSSSVGV